MSRSIAPALEDGLDPPAPDAPPSATIYTGGVLVSGPPRVIQTVIGSCISVCCFDPGAGVGGMNHYMLPAPTENTEDATSTRFGVHAMAELMTEMQRLGARRGRIVAKVFGGATVIQMEGTATSVPAQNIAFIREYVHSTGLPVAAWDVGGAAARVLRFHSWSGRAFVKRLDCLPPALRSNELRIVKSLPPLAFPTPIEDWP